MLINLITLEKIDRSSRVAFEARVEELVRIWEVRPVGKGKLHLLFVGVGDRDYSVARPYRTSHPLPFLDYLPVGLKDVLADAGKRFATPVRELCDQLVNTFRWIHWTGLAADGELRDRDHDTAVDAFRRKGELHLPVDRTGEIALHHHAAKSAPF